MLMKRIITQAILTKHMFCYDMNPLGERRLVFIESFKFLFFIFFHLSKMWYAKYKLLPFNQKTFFIETCAIQYKKD